MRALAFDFYVEKSKFFLCVQYLVKKTVILTSKMKKNVKQKAGFRCKCDFYIS